MSNGEFEVDRLTRVETKLDEVLRRLDTDVAPQRVDHENRLRRVEEKLTELATEFRVRLVMWSAGATVSGAGAATLISAVTGG